MAIKHYTFNYNVYDAEAGFKVDTELFTEEKAQLLLDFFSWRYDKENNPIDELIKKYALTAIKVATAENFNESGVKKWFKEQEGFLPVDGSQGVELNLVNAYEFDEELFDITIEEE